MLQKSKCRELFTETETDALLAAQDEFTELTDTPSSYTGEAGKYPKVNSGETALEFTANVLEIENADRNIYVDHDTGSDSNDGTSWGNAFQTMQTAVDDILPFVAAGVNIRIYCRGEFTEGDEEGACCSVSKICIVNVSLIPLYNFSELFNSSESGFDEILEREIVFSNFSLLITNSSSPESIAVIGINTKYGYF